MQDCNVASAAFSALSGRFRSWSVFGSTASGRRRLPGPLSRLSRHGSVFASGPTAIQCGRICHNRIPLNHFPFPVYGKSPLAARESDAAVVASWPFPGGLRPAQSFFQGYAVIGDHAPKDNRSMSQGMAQGGNQETTYNELCLGFRLVALNNSCVFVQIVRKSGVI